jgi:hypothetical protein
MGPGPASDRARLAKLLRSVTESPKNFSARVQAADLAVTLALRLGDCVTADVAEALAADLPKETPPHQRVQLTHIGATARAARRAISLARNHKAETPSNLAGILLENPEGLARDVQATQHENPRLADAILELATARHPENLVLQRLRVQKAIVNSSAGDPSIR